MNEAIIESYAQYQKNEDFTNALVRCHGMILSKIQKRDAVKLGLERLFSICHPEFNRNVINGNLAPAATNEDARQNVIKGLALTSVHNFEYVLDFIKEVHAGILINF
jgi:hypothetical protein